jgi:hypothetical protein
LIYVVPFSIFMSVEQPNRGFDIVTRLSYNHDIQIVINMVGYKIAIQRDEGPRDTHKIILLKNKY